MIIKKIQKNRGFVILFAVVISAIILTVALGVAEIAFREVKFSSSAQGANDAFFAADTGAECALFYDYNLGMEEKFPGEEIEMNCADKKNIIVSGGNDNGFSPWSFTLTELGENKQSCAIVTILRNSEDSTTKIVSKGYNDCNSTNPNRVERQLEVSY